MATTQPQTSPGERRYTAPPLGVYPRQFWREDRMKHLSGAIHAYIDGGFIGGGYRDTVLGWIEELTDLLESQR